MPGILRHSKPALENRPIRGELQPHDPPQVASDDRVIGADARPVRPDDVLRAARPRA